MCLVPSRKSGSIADFLIISHEFGHLFDYQVEIHEAKRNFIIDNYYKVQGYFPQLFSTSSYAPSQIGAECMANAFALYLDSKTEKLCDSSYNLPEVKSAILLNNMAFDSIIHKQFKIKPLRPKDSSDSLSEFLLENIVKDNYYLDFKDWEGGESIFSF